MNEAQLGETHGERAVPVDDAPTESKQKRPVVAAVVVCAVAMLPVLPVLLSVRATHAASHAAQTLTPAAPEIGAMEAAVARDPSPANRLNLSLAYIGGNAPGRAKPVLHELLLQDPASVAGWNNLCVAQVMLRELQDAIDDCTHALSLDGSYQLARNNLKWAQDVRQQELDALHTMEQTSPVERNAEFFIGQGTHFLHLGAYDQAIHAWQRTLLIDSQNAIAANNIGTAYMMKRQPDVAMTWFVKAIAWDPSMQIARNNLAWAQQESSANRQGH